MKNCILILFSVFLSLVFSACGGEEKQQEKTKLEKITENVIDYSPKTKFEKWEPKVRRSDGLGDFIVNLFQFIADSISYIVAAVIIFALVFIVVRLKPRFSMESVEEEKEAAEIDYNSIYNHNYRKEIDDLVTKHDYKGAIRLLYLCTLHSMNESGVVKWDEAKTPTEYYYELKRDNLKSCFFRVTSVFLNVVYGNSQADADLYAQVDADTRAIVKCLTPVIK